jgi:hypothetical protein
MHIQKKGNAFYLQTSTWSAEKGRSATKSTYLGSGIQNAINKLKTEVEEYDFMTLRDKLLKSNVKNPTEIFLDLQKQLSQIENALSELETIADKKTKILISKIKKSHTDLLATHSFEKPTEDENEINLFTKQKEMTEVESEIQSLESESDLEDSDFENVDVLEVLVEDVVEVVEVEPVEILTTVATDERIMELKNQGNINRIIAEILNQNNELTEKGLLWTMDNVKRRIQKIKREQDKL